jgi:hypothetical protein
MSARHLRRKLLLLSCLLLDALSHPDHEEHEDLKAWVGRPFNSTQRLSQSLKQRAAAKKPRLEISYTG